MTTPSDLRLTPTNSADDSQGSVWGIQGNLLWLILGGVFVGLLVLLVGFTMFPSSMISTLTVAVCPLVLTTAYAVFKQRHPPGYDVDLLDLFVCGRAFGPAKGQTDEFVHS